MDGYDSNQGARKVQLPQDEMGFEEAVLRSFAFLQLELGFKLIESGPTCVNYTNPNGLSVRISHGRSSFQVRLEVARPAADGKLEVLDAIDFGTSADPPREYFFQASTPEAVKNSVQKLALLLSETGRAVLRGDLFAFKRVRDQQLRNSKEVQLKWALADARLAAAQAWREGDFDAFVSALDPLKEDLSSTELKKLAYAETHRSKQR